MAADENRRKSFFDALVEDGYTFGKEESTDPSDRMTLGRVFDLGQITNKIVELDNRSLNMHTFITGSTGSGKSNTIYEIGDLMYLTMVLMLEMGITLDDIKKEMAGRHVIDKKVKQEKMVK